MDMGSPLLIEITGGLEQRPGHVLLIIYKLPSHLFTAMAPDVNTMPELPGNLALSSRSPPSGRTNHEGSNIPPMRHPRPMTAAELHLELEIEQESLVSGHLNLNMFQSQYHPRQLSHIIQPGQYPNARALFPPRTNRVSRF